MAATVQIVEKNGAGATATDKTSGTIRMKNADDATVNDSNRMVVPGSGWDFSFEKWLRLRNTTPPGVAITNPKFYTDGSNGWTDVKLQAKAEASYATPAEVSSTTSYTDAFTYTSGAALALGSVSQSSTGEFGNHVVLALLVGSTAVPGTLTSETITFSYDET